MPPSFFIHYHIQTFLIQLFKHFYCSSSSKLHLQKIVCVLPTDEEILLAHSWIDVAKVANQHQRHYFYFLDKIQGKIPLRSRSTTE